jgi:hypothetical protein
MQTVPLLGPQEQTGNRDILLNRRSSGSDVSDGSTVTAPKSNFRFRPESGL